MLHFPNLMCITVLSLLTPSINLYSNVTTIEFPGNDIVNTNDFTVRNGSNSQVYTTVAAADMRDIVYGDTTHLFANVVSNVNR